MSDLPAFLIDKYDRGFERASLISGSPGFNVSPHPDPMGDHPSAIFVSSHDKNWAEEESGDLFGYYNTTHPYIYIGNAERFSEMHANRNVPSNSMSVAWEYWNGDEWSSLPTIQNTLFSTSAPIIEFEVPQDWKSKSIWNVPSFYIRGTFTTTYSYVLSSGGFGLYRSDEWAIGYKISISLDNTTLSGYDWTDWQFALYRDHDLLVMFNADREMPNLTFLDTKLQRNQNLSYTVEILNKAEGLYQSEQRRSSYTDNDGNIVAGDFLILPAKNPIMPDNFEVEIVDHGNPEGKARVKWHTNLNCDPGLLPSRFELSATESNSGTLEVNPNPNDLNFIPGQADYDIEVPFSNYLSFADKLGISGVSHAPPSYSSYANSGILLTGLTFDKSTYQLQSAYRFPVGLNEDDKSTDAEEWNITTDQRSDLYILIPSELTDAYLPTWLSDYKEMPGNVVLTNGSTFTPRIFKRTVEKGSISLPGLFGDGSTVYSGSLSHRYIPLLVGNEIQATDVTWSLKSIDNSNNESASTTNVTSIKKYFSLPKPTINISNILIGTQKYSFKVTITIPEYNGIDRYVNGFKILPTNSNFFENTIQVSTTDNTYSWVESEIDLNVFPSYDIKSFVTMSPETYSFSISSHYTFDDSLLGTNPENGAELGSLDTSKLSAPCIKIQYTGLSLDDWIDWIVEQITEPIIINGGEVIPYSGDPSSTTPDFYTSYRWVDSGDAVHWDIYLPESGWTTISAYIEDAYEEELLTLPQIVKYSYVDNTTGSTQIAYYQYKNSSMQLLSTVFRENFIAACGISGTLPEYITTTSCIEGDDSIVGLDTFTKNTYGKYNLGDFTTFQGPAIVSMPTANTAHPTGYLSQDNSASSLRISGNDIKYGRYTNIHSVSELVSAVNSNPGYNATSLINAPLSGGEIVINLNPISVRITIPQTSLTDGTFPLLPETADNLFISGYETIGTNYVGVVKSNYAEIIIVHYPSYANFALDETNVILDRSPDGSLLLHSSKILARYDTNVRMQLLPPRETSETDSWFPRINMGRFIVNDGEIPRVYSITEFPMQEWSINYGAPYKDVKYQKATIIDPTTIRVQNTPMYIEGRNIDLIINGKRNNQIIEDWDTNNGLIFLSSPIQTSDLAMVSYTFKETSYVYKNINLNPHRRFSNNLLGKYVAFFVVDRDEVETENFPIENLYGLARSVYHRTFETLDILNAFVDTVNSSGSWPNDEVVTSGGDHYDGDVDYSQKPIYLGYYYINPSSPNHVVIQDTRKEGGGIVESMSYTELVQKNRFAAGYYDMGHYDGRSFGALVAIVELPNHIKEKLSEDRILREVTSHIPMGTMLLLSYYKDVKSNMEVVWPLPEGYNDNQSLLDLKDLQDMENETVYDAENDQRSDAYQEMLDAL